MQGTILSFHPETNTGLISGHDGTRYSFARANWTSPKLDPTEGLTVDFDVEPGGKIALQIIVIETRPNGKLDERKKGIAILWAIFFGWMGAHKFYLRETNKGVLYLIFFWTAIPAIIAFIESISLILMSESEFNRKFNY